MKNEELQKLKDALEIGCDAAHEVAQRFHEEMKGYCEAEHKQVDKNVEEIEIAMGVLVEISERQAAGAMSLSDEQIIDMWNEGDCSGRTATIVNFARSLLATAAKPVQEPPSQQPVAFQYEANTSDGWRLTFDTQDPRCKQYGLRAEDYRNLVPLYAAAQADPSQTSLYVKAYENIMEIIGNVLPEHMINFMVQNGFRLKYLPDPDGYRWWWEVRDNHNAAFVPAHRDLYDAIKAAMLTTGDAARGEKQ